MKEVKSYEEQMLDGIDSTIEAYQKLKERLLEKVAEKENEGL